MNANRWSNFFGGSDNDTSSPSKMTGPGCFTFCGLKTFAHLALLLAQVCFSGWHIVGSLAMSDGADPFVFVLYRECIASVLMFAYAKYCGVEIRVDKEDRLRFAFLGLFSFINVVGAMLALKYISATRFAIFQPSIPCIGTLISLLLGLERISILKILAIAMAVAGAVITETWKNGSSEEQHESNVLIGTIIVTVQVTGMACLIVFQKPILHKYPSSAVTVIYYSLGSLYTVLLCAAWSYTFTASSFSFNGSLLPWLALAYATTFATFYPYNAYSWAGKQLTPSATSVYSTFQPVGTIVLSLVILGTVVTLPEGVGAALVICGLLLNVWSQRYESKDHNGSGSDDGGSVGTEGERRSEGTVQGSFMENKAAIGTGGIISGFVSVPTIDPEAASSGGLQQRLTTEGSEEDESLGNSGSYRSSVLSRASINSPLLHSS